MATFETYRDLTAALGDEGAEAVAGYVTDATRDLATRSDFAELRVDFAELRADFADLRGDMYRALWIQGAAVVTIITAVVGVGAAIITALS